MKTIETFEYRVSARVVITAGDTFRASGGPYFATRDDAGKKIKSSMAAKGPFRFISYNERGRKKWIVAWSKKEGGFAVLPLTRWKTCDLPGFVNRPYKILGKKRDKGAQR
jgi:hypothetical protein